MKKLIFLLLALLAAAGAAGAARMLPLDSRELVSVKYSGWNGVLRIWIAEGWQSGSGSLTGWLNRCASLYEKKHNGVYIQITSVEPSQLASFDETGLRAPDAILFSPGMLQTADGLSDLPDYPLRDRVQTSPYAVPVAMGGYAWAVSDSGSDVISIPSDDETHSWSAAALALSTQEASGTEPLPEQPGVDLGLPSLAVTNPYNMVVSESAYTDFINGAASVMPVTQREISRLKNLSDRGRGPDWTIDVLSEFAFTDQLLLFAIPESDHKERMQLTLEYLNQLLDVECQTALTGYGAFPVTDAPAEYPSTDPLASLDLILRMENLITPPVFDNNWRADAKEAIDEFRTGTERASDAFRRLFGFSG